MLTTLENASFNYQHKDSMFFTFTGVNEYPANDDKLLQRWKKYTMYMALNGLALQSASDTVAYNKEALFNKEPEIRKKIITREKNNIHGKMEELTSGNLIQETFLNAIAMSYDPHSEYFPLNEKKDFESDLSRTKPSYGIEFNESFMGDVTIGRVVPGGPAWKSNELNKGDILLQIKTASGRVIDMMDTGLSEAEELMDEEKSDMITLTVKKPDGSIRKVKLVKEVLTNEQNLIQSFVLKGDKTIGYISLPGFYTDFNNPSGLGCANDVAKEIIKLQSDKIQGLIIDLRNNGGGSISEALGLAGIFINEGPLLMAGYKGNTVHIMKDPNRGTIYNGPLVVLVNGYSASASEMVSAILQDYHRALIVGTRTYGKATGQVIIPMDTTLNLNAPNKREKQTDFVKITVEKLFRLDGNSYQGEGIIPDITITNPQAVFYEKESDYPTALKNDSVYKRPIYDQLPALPVDKIKEKLAEDHPELNKDTHTTLAKQQILKKEGNRIMLNIDSGMILNMQNAGSYDSTANNTLAQKWKIEYPTMDKSRLSVDPYLKDTESRVKTVLLHDRQLYAAFLSAGYLAEFKR